MRKKTIKKKPQPTAPRASDRAGTAKRNRKCILRLYIAGATERSQQAVLRARQLCEDPTSNFELQIIDIYQQPILARDGQILATPTLVRELPRPVRRLIGDLSNTANLLVGLHLTTKTKAGG